MYDDSERRSRTLLGSIPDPAWLRDRDGRFPAVNDAYLALCGRPREQLFGCLLEEAWSVWRVAAFHYRYGEVLAADDRRGGLKQLAVRICGLLVDADPLVCWGASFRLSSVATRFGVAIYAWRRSGFWTCCRPSLLWSKKSKKELTDGGGVPIMAIFQWRH